MACEPILKKKKVLTVGGGLVGCETALWLAQHGKDVTIVEALDKVMAVNGPLCHANKDMLDYLITNSSYHKILCTTKQNS